MSGVKGIIGMHRFNICLVLSLSYSGVKTPLEYVPIQTAPLCSTAQRTLCPNFRGETLHLLQIFFDYAIFLYNLIMQYSFIITGIHLFSDSLSRSKILLRNIGDGF